MRGFNDQIFSDHPEIFFRAADRLQIESYLTALQRDNKSLVLLSKHKALLSYYGELVVQRIHRAFPQSSLEVLLPADTEGLLERFNAILNNLSFEVATRPNPKGKPDKIWLIQDAKALGEKDIQILLKLIENFPGAGICAVLMFDSSETEALSIFENNPKINTWVLSLPTPEQKLNAIQQARQNGIEEIALEFFNQLAKSEKTSSSQKVRRDEPLSEEKITSLEKSDHSQTKISVGKKRSALPLIAAITLLGISLAIGFVLHPEIGEKFLGLLPNKSKQFQVVQTSDLDTSSNATDDKNKEVEISEVAKLGQQWLMNLPKDYFVIAFQTFETSQAAQESQETKDWLKRTYILPVREEGSKVIKYLLVDGPYRTANIAKRVISRIPTSDEIVIENVGSLSGSVDHKQSKP
jgi:hypothetical protein